MGSSTETNRFSYLCPSPTIWLLPPDRMVHPPREHSDRLDYTKRLLTQLMLWVEHYNACVERKSRELPRDVWSHSFTFLSVEFEEAAESSAEDIQKMMQEIDDLQKYLSRKKKVAALCRNAHPLKSAKRLLCAKAKTIHHRVVSKRS